MGDKKFRNKKTFCLSRHEHDSKFEANYCNRLLAMKQKKEIADYDIQVPFDFIVVSQLICRHFVDFVVYKSLTDIECHETKGCRTAVWEIKRKLFRALYPTIPYIVISKRR